MKEGNGLEWSGGSGVNQNDQLIQQLVEGQEELKTDVTVLKTDVNELKEGQRRLEGDVSELKEGQRRLEGDVSELKEGQLRLEGDVSELKEGQRRLEGDVSELKEGQNRLTTVVINIENILLTKLNVLFDADSSRRGDIEAINEDQSAQYKKLEDHEMRILKLENAKKITK